MIINKNEPKKMLQKKKILGQTTYISSDKHVLVKSALAI